MFNNWFQSACRRNKHTHTRAQAKRNNKATSSRGTAADCATLFNAAGAFFPLSCAIRGLGSQRQKGSQQADNTLTRDHHLSASFPNVITRAVRTPNSLPCLALPCLHHLLQIYFIYFYLVKKFFCFSFSSSSSANGGVYCAQTALSLFFLSLPTPYIDKICALALGRP